MSQTPSAACCNTVPVVAKGYEPKGKYVTVDGMKTYVTGPSTATSAILYVYDIFGFFPQSLQGADILAHADNQHHYQVFMPDFFEGKPADISWYPPDNDEKKGKLGNFFKEQGAPPKTVSRIPKVLKEIEQSHSNIKSWGIAGFCWGGKASNFVVSLSSQQGTVFKAAAAVHPAMVDPKDAPGISIPILMLPSKGEERADVEAFEKELKVKHKIEWFPDQVHGFMAARGDLEDSSVKAAYEKGYNMLLSWFHEHILADNPIFAEIGKLHSQSHAPFTHLLPIYVFPSQQVETSGFLSSDTEKSPYPEARSEVGKFWRCGPLRAKFLAESVWDLKKSLEGIGSGLEVRVGMVGDVVRQVLEQLKAETVSLWMTFEEGVEEKREEKAVRKEVEGLGKEFRLWTDEKYFIDDRDTPYKRPQDVEDVFTLYRQRVEPLRDAPRRVLAAPKSLPPLPPSIPSQAAPFTIPTTLEATIAALKKPLDPSLDLKHPPIYPPGAESAHPFIGGSAPGHDRIKHLITSGSMSSYKMTRNGMLGQDFSTKLSAWLALGCITARQVHRYLVDFEEGRTDLGKTAPGYGAGENKSTYAVRFELLWRDYMRLCTHKFGPRLFRVTGLRDREYNWSYDKEKLARWLHGTTGTGLIDASQRELFLTGYTSNRARQNVASYLAKHLEIDWRFGAEWYECCLIDYDVNSNWNNWQYNAGQGNDPRGEGRVFNPVKQANDYDPDSAYIKTWVPEVRGVDSPEQAWQCWKVPEDRRKELGLQGNIMAEQPLKKIEYRPGGGKRREGGGGGGHFNNRRGSERGGKGGKSGVGRGRKGEASQKQLPIREH